MEKLKTTAQKLDTVFKVLQSVLFALAIAAGVCIALIAIGFALRLDPDTIATGYEMLDIGFLELSVTDACAPDKWLVLLEAAIMLALSAVCVLIGLKGVGHIRTILGAMTEGAPFSDAVCTALKKLSVTGVLLGLAGNALDLTQFLFLMFVYDLPKLLLSQNIQQATGNYVFDAGFLIWSGVLLLLSYVFRYGTQLQQLSDETL